MNETTGSAYVRNGRLCIIGLHESNDVGPVPFTVTVDGVEVEDGPVDIGVEGQNDPAIHQALQKAKQPMLSKIEDEKMKSIAQQWVDRARAGDQNAMALIAGVRQNAAKGVERAKKASKFLGEYIKKNPVDLREGPAKRYLPENSNKALIQKLSQFNGDDAAVSAWSPSLSKNDRYLTALILADGPFISMERIASIGEHFGEDKKDFIMGVKGWDIPPISDSDAHHAGRAVGNARVLQGVRMGACPVSALSRVAGWELGE